MQFAQKLEQLEKRYEELTQQMADPAVISDSDQYRKITKAQSELAEIVGKYRDWKRAADALSQARAMLDEKDADLHHSVMPLSPHRVSAVMESTNLVDQPEGSRAIASVIANIVATKPVIQIQRRITAHFFSSAGIN